jgi:hypothetical protein
MPNIQYFVGNTHTHTHTNIDPNSLPEAFFTGNFFFKHFLVSVMLEVKYLKLYEITLFLSLCALLNEENTKVVNTWKLKPHSYLAPISFTLN